MKSSGESQNAARCVSDPLRRARQYARGEDAQRHYLSLLRNGTDAQLCHASTDRNACVCEVRPVSEDDLLAQMAEGVPW